jgi:RoxA-like, cytochrome c-like/Cytochrome c
MYSFLMPIRLPLMLAWVVVGHFVVACGECGAAAADVAAVKYTYLDQGWTADERERFYYTTQGSQLIPYDWFLALETVSGEPFRSDAHLARLRFIPQPKGDRNRDGLPVGFVKDDNPDNVFDIKRAFLGENYANRDYPRTNAWLGLTCAACHTARIESATATITIDGGPAMVDVQTFLESLTKALEATHKDRARMQRFARQVLGDNHNEDEEAALKRRVEAYTGALAKMVERNASPVRYGFARLDAFGAILNEICATALEIPDNRQPSDAPASYPFLWETAQLDWVQWNGSVNNPLVRNVGEVLGVFAHFSLTAANEADRFQSTVNVRNLFELEQQIDKLRSPAWPAEHLGCIDRKKAERGAKLYAENCAKCHAVRGADGKFPLTQPNALGHRFINTTMVPLEEIRTDDRLAVNFLKHLAKPGPLGRFLQPPLQGQPMVPRLILLRTAGKKIIERKLSEIRPPLDKQQLGALTGFRDDTPPTEKHLRGYKARPLEGVWATAPYLHNGSVPNLYQLLLPADSRVKTFWVGSLKFDPQHVGFATEKFEGGFEFRTHDDAGRPIPGNSNAGHTGPWYTQTKAPDGSCRDFTDEERWDLIEYLKTGGGSGSAQALECSPPQEAEQIAELTELTLKLLKQRYGGNLPVLRAVHPKDHGCVKAVFEINANIPEALRVGVFSQPGRKYDAWIRFSNAAALVGPDLTPGLPASARNGSRGMAIKLMGVEGQPIIDGEGPTTQDFLMVNLPVFPFANVSDYLELNRALFEHKDDVVKAFTAFAAKVPPERAMRAGQINAQIRAISLANPLESRYFSAAPFLFGKDRVMKFGVQPGDTAQSAMPENPGPNYLREALIKHLRTKPASFDFLVQVRAPGDSDLAIEDVTVEWKEAAVPFQKIARITIPAQEFDSPESRAVCENLFFTPWHSIESHRPLGGINRLRKHVYLESSRHRHHPKEPAGNR